jgi:hypothetical protein
MSFIAPKDVTDKVPRNLKNPGPGDPDLIQLEYNVVD